MSCLGGFVVTLSLGRDPGQEWVQFSWLNCTGVVDLPQRAVTPFLLAYLHSRGVGVHGFALFSRGALAVSSLYYRSASDPFLFHLVSPKAVIFGFSLESVGIGPCVVCGSLSLVRGTPKRSSTAFCGNERRPDLLPKADAIGENEDGANRCDRRKPGARTRPHGAPRPQKAHAAHIHLHASSTSIDRSFLPSQLESKKAKHALFSLCSSFCLRQNLNEGCT